jgi:antitoxin MazE
MLGFLLAVIFARVSPSSQRRIGGVLMGYAVGYLMNLLKPMIDVRQADPIHFPIRISKEPFMRVAKWGNSLAVRLPAAVIEALELKEGEEIEINIAGRRTFDIARAPDREDVVKRLRAFRGRLPPDFRFDRDEANAR